MGEDAGEGISFFFLSCGLSVGLGCVRQEWQ